MEYQKTVTNKQPNDKRKYNMPDNIDVRMDGKSLVNTNVKSYLEELTKGAHLGGFYKASKELAPLLGNAKPATKFEIEMPYGIYTGTVAEIDALVTEVLETRASNQVHYDAIEKANLILSTKAAFQLKGTKPESKRGKPKSKLAFE